MHIYPIFVTYPPNLSTETKKSRADRIIPHRISVGFYDRKIKSGDVYLSGCFYEIL